MLLNMTSLNTLRIFQVAAKHLSFTQAARELYVNQPAISRQIAMLEKQLGTTLFFRTRPKLSLTSDGERLYTAVSAGLEQIETALHTIYNRNDNKSLVVRTSIGFASCFLINHLNLFSALHPEIEMELVTNDRFHEYDPTDFDIAIIFGHPNALHHYQPELVFPELLIPVCAPDYFQGENQLSASNISSANLLHLNEPEHIGNWEIYFAETDITTKEREKADTFNSYMVYLHAALNGKGITLGWGGLIEDFVSTNRLRVLGDRYVRTERGFYSCVSERGRKNGAVEKFTTWLTDSTKTSREQMLKYN